MKEGAELFTKTTGIPVQVTAGPELQRIDRAQQDADLVRLPENEKIYRGTPIAATRISKRKDLAREFIAFLKTEFQRLLTS